MLQGDNDNHQVLPLMHISDHQYFWTYFEKGATSIKAKGANSTGGTATSAAYGMPTSTLPPQTQPRVQLDNAYTITFGLLEYLDVTADQINLLIGEPPGNGK